MTKLHEAGVGTLLVHAGESELYPANGGRWRSGGRLLTARVISAIDDIHGSEEFDGLTLGCFGTGVGATAVLVAAAERSQRVAAVVSGNGRPHVDGDVLSRLAAPTLFIVESDDSEVVELNHQAALAVSAPVQLELVQAADDQRIGQPGAQEHIAEVARGWFVWHLTGAEYAS
jgi:putative phosphoribosyl transferase